MTSRKGPGLAGDLARRAFDSVADIQAVQDLEALNRIAGQAFAGFGFDMLANPEQWIGYELGFQPQ